MPDDIYCQQAFWQRTPEALLVALGFRAASALPVKTLIAGASQFARA